MPNSRRCCPIPQRGEWKSSFSKCRTRNRYVSAQCTFFHSWNKVVRGREMVPLIGELFSSIRRQRRETDDRSCVPVRFFLYFSFFVSFFAYLFEGSSPKLSVKIRDHRCWRGWRVFDAERMEGKHWREKKKKNAVEASRVHENVRDRGEERLDEGARSKGSWKGNVNLWDHVDRSHARLFLYIIHRLHSTCVSTC